jgi:FkbM family methyltransferase
MSLHHELYARSRYFIRRISLSSKAPSVHLCRFKRVVVALDLSEPNHRGIYLSGDFEPELGSVMKKVFRPGDTFFDIGANMGWHTLNLLMDRPDISMAYAIEPQQRNVDLLRAGVRANNLQGRCHVSRLAVTAEKGKISLKRFEGMDSMHTSVYPLGDLPYEEEEVASETLDWLVDTFKATPAVIKCDVEGSELNVLEGAREILSGKKGTPPIWFIEANYETSAMAGYFPWQLVELGAEYGYKPYTIRRNKVIPVSPRGLRHGDVLVLAVPDVHATRISN